MSELQEALGVGVTVGFAGREWQVRPLTFNDLCDLEERFGDISRIDLSRVANQRFVLWTILRGESGITEKEVGSLLTIDTPKEVSDFIGKVFRLSGLTRGDDAEETGKNGVGAGAGRGSRKAAGGG